MRFIKDSWILLQQVQELHFGENISLQEEQEPRQLSDLGYWYTAEPSGFPRNQSLVPHDRNTPKQWQVLESLPASHIPSKAHSGLENFEVLKTF